MSDVAYKSGPAQGADFAPINRVALNAYGLDIHDIGGAPGRASGLKICAAAVSKGVVLLAIQAFTCARTLGVHGLLGEELDKNPAVNSARRRAPNFGPDAYRWASEMDEIGATMEAAGLSSGAFEGFAALCRLAEGTELGNQTKEDKSARTDFDGIVELLAEAASRSQSTSRPN